MFNYINFYLIILLKKISQLSIVLAALVLSGCTLLQKPTVRPVNDNLIYMEVEGIRYYYPKDYEETENPQFLKSFANKNPNALGGANNTGMLVKETDQAPTTVPTQKDCQDFADVVLEVAKEVSESASISNITIINEVEGYYGCDYTVNASITDAGLSFTMRTIQFVKKGVTDKFYSVGIFYDSTAGAEEIKNLEDSLLLSR